MNRNGNSQRRRAPNDTEDAAERLVAWFDDLHYVIALSGGVDSAVVAMAAVLSGKPCKAITADSPSVARREMLDALAFVSQTGIEHVVLKTDELADVAYRRNDMRRCYYCKSQLFATIKLNYPTAVVLTGTNFDDLNDYRPGLEAAEESGIRAPLAELGIAKATVRELASRWGVALADKPASPCLASRLAYGVSVTESRLAMVERAEEILHQLGLGECRMRLHEGNLGRIEVPATLIPQLADPQVRPELAKQLKQLGFRFITLDLEGFRSGSLNDLVQIGDHSAG